MGICHQRTSKNAFKLLGKEIYYTKFTNKTFLGLTGPLIRWSDVSKLPRYILILIKLFPSYFTYHFFICF